MDAPDVLRKLSRDPSAITATLKLNSAGGHVYVVGGAVRDTILGKEPKDFDLLVIGMDQQQIEDALIPDGAKWYGRMENKSIEGHVGTDEIPLGIEELAYGWKGGSLNLVGKHFGVYLFKHEGYETEVAMPRTEVSSGRGHKDFKVFTDPNLPLETDLARRDFTVNAMAVDTETGQLIDPFNGLEHLNTSKLMLVNPFAFQEDPLRIVRALVANAVHGLEPDPAVVEAMRVNAHRIRHLPGERLQMELDKLLTGSDPARAIRLARECGVLEYLLPEVNKAFGVDQKTPYHDLDVGEHSLKVLQEIQSKTDDPDLRLAALLHDIGKPDSIWVDEKGQGHFYANPDDPDSVDHADLGAEYADALMKNLKYSNARRNRVVSIVKHHMYPNFNSGKGGRKFLSNIGGDHKLASDLLTLRSADARGKMNLEQLDDPGDNQREIVRHIVDTDSAVTVKNLAIDGKDLISLGMEPGPAMGVLLKQLLEAIVENPELNNRQDLIELAQEIVNGQHFGG